MARRTACTALACFLFACGQDATDPTAPPAGPAITLSLTIAEFQSPEVTEDEEGRPRIVCRVRLRARASGTGTATWEGGLLRWYLGADRSAPIDSTAIPPADVQAGWGTSEIVAGQTQEADWQLFASIPFGVEIEFRYRPAGASSAATTAAQFTCGPTVPVSAQPPVITELSFVAPPGDLEPRDTVEIRYAATSDVGLWQSFLVLDGPCELQRLVTEELRRDVARTVRFALPAECLLGVPISVAVYTLDAALQESGRTLATSSSLVDVTPPAISVLFPQTPSPRTELSGTFFEGDTILVDFGAGDNHELRAMIWEVQPAGTRDSVLLAIPDTGFRLRLGVQAEWIGQSQFLFYARDAVGLTSDTVVSAPGAVNIYATVNRPTVSTTLQNHSRDVVIDTARGLLYVLQDRARILVLSASTLANDATIDTPEVPGGFDLTAGGDSLVMTLPSLGALGFVDLRQAALEVTVYPLTNLDTAFAQRPRLVTVTASGNAFVALEGNASEAYTMLEVDLATLDERLRPDAGSSGLVGGGVIERSHDRSTFVVSSPPAVFQAYDASSDLFGPLRAQNDRGTVSVDGRGARVAVQHDVYDASLNFLRTVESPILCGSCFLPTALSMDGSVLYTLLGSWVFRSGVSDGRMMDRSPNPIIANMVRAAPDGALLVTIESSGTGTSRISVIDMR